VQGEHVVFVRGLVGYEVQWDSFVFGVFGIGEELETMVVLGSVIDYSVRVPVAVGVLGVRMVGTESARRVCSSC
jgi:hypothetical protein